MVSVLDRIAAGGMLAGSPPSPGSGAAGFGVEPDNSPAALRVKPERAMAVTTLQSCVRLISEVLATLPVHIVERGDKSRKERRDREFRHVWGKPNPDTNRVNYWEAQYAAALLWGQAFPWKGRDRSIRFDEAEPWRGITELWHVHPARVRIAQTPQSRKIFELDRDPKQPASSRELMHVPLISLDGVSGMSIVEQAANDIGVAMHQKRLQRQFFSKNAVPPAAISVPEVLNETEAREIVETWYSSHRGGPRHFDFGVLGGGAKIETYAIPAIQAQFIEQIGLTREDVISLFRVPPHLLGLITKSTSWGTGIEQQGLAFLAYTLLPLLIRFEQAIESDLLPDELEVKFNLTGLLRADSKTRAEFYQKMRQNGLLSADTIREFEDLPPREIPDDYLIPGNMTRILVDDPEAAETPAQPHAARQPPPLAAEARCPQCDKLIGEQVGDARLYCSKCEAHRVWRRGEYAGDGVRDVRDAAELIAEQIAARMMPAA